MNIPANVKKIPNTRNDHFLKKLFNFLVLFIDIKVAAVKIVITDNIPSE